ncbi:hypothetical protein H4Q26_015504 [Puccinia striiformis f. sp. tritici PST-130]|nr:hypothetical protein H4Q26_015504 [Puccinia striiformis f. sp. tritici PST-130]
MNTFSSPIEATHVGTLKIGAYFINPVYHVPNGCANILSASQLIDHGLKPHFKTDQFILKGGDKIVASFPHIVLQKDVKSLPATVQNNTHHRSNRYARLPGGLSSSSSSDSSDDESSESEEPVVQRPPERSPHEDQSDSESEVSFETEAAAVFRRGQLKKELRRKQNQSGSTVRPNNVDNSVNGPPNQGRHYSLPDNALSRLKPGWEYVTDHRPAKEIRGDVDASNILQTRRRQQPPQASSSIDQQPDIVNLVQPVSMTDALASPLEKPLWLEAMSNEHASQLAHITGDLQYLRAVHEQCVVGFQSNMKLHDMMVKQFCKITAHEDHRVDLEDHSLAEIKLCLGDVESKVDQLHVVIPENQERTSEQLSRYLNRVERMFEDGEDTVSKLHKVHNLEVTLQEHHRDNRALLEAQFNTFQDVLSRIEAQSVHASLTLNTLEAKLVSSMEHQLQGIQTRITCNCLNSNMHTACHQAPSQVNSSTPPGQEMSHISPPGEEIKIVPSISPTPAPQQTFNNHNTIAENNASPCLSDITAAPWGSMNKDMHKMILQTTPKTDKSPDNQEKNSKSLTCYECGTSGHKSTSCPQRKSKKKVQNLTPDDNESSSSDNHSDAESLPSDQEDSDESGYSSNAILQEDPKNISSIQVIQHEKLPSKSFLYL